MISKIKKFIKSNDSLFLYMKQGLIYFRYLKSIGKKSEYDKLPQYEVVENIVISEKEKHCYFGYYDKSPLDSKSKRALFVRLPQNSKEGDVAEVCIYDIATKMQTVIGKTSAWNWQQACMEQWVNDNVVSYNRYNVEKKEYQAVLHNLSTGEDKVISRAAYSYNMSFTKYLSLNFYRLDTFAKGYGYPYQVDSMDEKEDGIWEVDVLDNYNRLILSLADVMQFEPREYMNFQHYINHVAYCPNERYIIFIHRWQLPGGEFVSRLLRYDLLEKKLKILLDNGHVSHYCWKTNSELMIYATNNEQRKGYMIVNIGTGDVTMLSGLPAEDGHPSYSKDGKWILTDTYPSHKRKQFLFLFDTMEEKLYRLDELYSPFKYYNDFRCDLHPRWSFDNKYICVDNTQTGKRSLKIYRLS